MRIFLSGPMGSGKSTVAKAVAARGGLPLYDLDQQIERRYGGTVAELFASRGEAVFREWEATLLRELVAEHASGVFALGGGTVTDAKLRAELLQQGLLLTLRADVAELVKRVGATGSGRPLLAVSDVASRLQELLQTRAAAYAECHASLDTDGRDPASLAGSVLELAADAPIVVALGLRTYRVEVGSGIRTRLGERVNRAAKGPRVLLVSDQHVAAHWAAPITAALQAAGKQVITVVLPPGEEHKTLRSVEQIWQAGLDGRLDRSSAVVALGGGVVGDLAGFAASTLLRGVAVGHVPTTLLAMVDSAIGGKTGFDSAHGKNLIGSFHQPSFVLSDVDMLATLPEAERRAGMAEVVKSAWIDGEAAVAQLERDAAALRAGDPLATLRAIHMSVAVKARIVSQDERESELRAVLNLGHTLGHAIEAAQAYQGMRHGEAVALGMVAALRVAVRLGEAEPSDAERVIGLLSGLGLGTDVRPYLHARVLSFISADKKRNSDTINFVLPGKPGRVKVRGIPLPELLALLGSLEA